MKIDLNSLYRVHDGKVSDKWESYLNNYDKQFESFKYKNINLLEIGVQNGGSLEIWTKFFPNGNIFIGCDINPKCKNLMFSDNRIVVIDGDAGDEKTKERVLKVSKSFDLIIDDGSHQSSDIIRNFIRYFPTLNHDGLYVIEDLHCSYWQDYEGGCFHPYSSIAFLKALIDIINAEHWGNDYSINDFLSEIEIFYGVSFSNVSLSQIKSIEFSNSLCFIKKSNDLSKLGKRIVVGSDDNVYDIKNYQSKSVIDVPNQKSNIHAYKFTVGNPSQIKEPINRLMLDHIQNLSTALSCSRDELTQASKIIDTLYSSKSWKLTAPLRVISKIINHPKMPILRILSLLYPKEQNIISLSNKNITKKEPLKIVNKKLTLFVVIHVFYPEVLLEILDHLKNWKCSYTLCITTTEDKKIIVRDILESFKASYQIVVCENRGRDVLPFLKVFENIPINTGVILKLHTKRSLHRTDGDAWRRSLLNKLVSYEYVDKIISAFNNNPNLGMVIPENTYVSMRDCIGETEHLIKNLANRMNGNNHIELPDGFSAGTMFYVRRSDLQALLDLELGEEDFENEEAQLDGTMAHALERLFFVSSKISGHYVATCENLNKPAEISANQFWQRRNW